MATSIVLRKIYVNYNWYQLPTVRKMYTLLHSHVLHMKSLNSVPLNLNTK